MKVPCHLLLTAGNGRKSLPGQIPAPHRGPVRQPRYCNNFFTHHRVYHTVRRCKPVITGPPGLMATGLSALITRPAIHAAGPPAQVTAGPSSCAWSAGMVAPARGYGGADDPGNRRSYPAGHDRRMNAGPGPSGFSVPRLNFPHQCGKVNYGEW